jgi:hypothetical protein
MMHDPSRAQKTTQTIYFSLWMKSRLAFRIFNA